MVWTWEVPSAQEGLRYLRKYYSIVVSEGYYVITEPDKNRKLLLTYLGGNWFTVYAEPYPLLLFKKIIDLENLPPLFLCLYKHKNQYWEIKWSSDRYQISNIMKIRRGIKKAQKN